MVTVLKKRFLAFFYRFFSNKKRFLAFFGAKKREKTLFLTRTCYPDLMRSLIYENPFLTTALGDTEKITQHFSLPSILKSSLCRQP